MTKGILASCPRMLMLFFDSAGNEIVTCVLQKVFEKERVLGSDCTPSGFQSYHKNIVSKRTTF